MNVHVKNLILTPFNLLYKVNPKLTIQLLYRLKQKKKLNLENPRSYLEKLNWLKIYDRNPLMPVCADKYRVRGYIEEQGLGEHLPKLLWHGKNPDDIPVDTLPNQFVIKVSTGSKRNIFCYNKADFDWKKAKAKLRRWMKGSYLPCYGEWMYAASKPTIVIEEMLSDGVHRVPEDYKIFTFNDPEHRIGCISVTLGRFVNARCNFYDRNWNMLSNVNVYGKLEHIEGETTEKPVCLAELCAAAEKLSKPFVHVRVDFYVIGDNFYIGEMTFFNDAGFGSIRPESFNLEMGSWMKLPEKA